MGPTCALMVLSCASDPGTAVALSPQDQAAAFTAAGFARTGEVWRACPDSSSSDTPGAIGEARDLNGDGRPEAVITEGGTYCYGNTGVGYRLVSKQPDGSWTLVTGGVGVPRFLDTSGVDGWPDIEVGGPGFCFAVERWNGREYVLLRYQYDGKPCSPR